MNKKDIEKIISEKLLETPKRLQIGFFKNKYNTHGRYYHNWTHILKLVGIAYQQNSLTVDMLLAILFHDIVYDPIRNDNEEKSAEMFKFHYGRYFTDDKIYNTILSTKNHISDDCDNWFQNYLNNIDMSILYSDFKSFSEYEMGIFKEYQFVDYKTYKEKRIKFLEDNNVNSIYIDYVRNFAPKIAIYPGSFDPFHKGHLDILHKAEKIFDKVIIARGVNPSKDIKTTQLPSVLKFNQCDTYEGLLTDYIDSLGYDVTVVRGLRNSTDFEYEKTQYRFLKDLKRDIKVVNIIADTKFEHVSSSAIRSLDKHNKGNMYKVC